MDERSGLTLSDHDLVGRILERDGRAFETLFERYGEMIRRYLAHMVDDNATAQDLVQEVFLRVWTRADQWDGRGSFKAWLYRIATNLAFNHLRSTRRRKEQPLEIAGEWDDADENAVPAWVIDTGTPEPEDVLEMAERHNRYRRLVARLSGEKREVLHLVHEMEMSLEDAADELGIPEGTVKSRLYYARQRLAQEWRDLEEL
jgi:RNA polymerase sigma-70 factor (ECF subfamily)